MGNLSGISLELVGKSDVFVWECVGNAQGLLGNKWGIGQGLLRIIWETVDIRAAAGKCIGNSSGILTNYLGNRWYS